MSSKKPTPEGVSDDGKRSLLLDGTLGRIGHKSDTSATVDDTEPGSDDGGVFITIIIVRMVVLSWYLQRVKSDAGLPSPATILKRFAFIVIGIQGILDVGTEGRKFFLPCFIKILLLTSAKSSNITSNI